MSDGKTPTPHGSWPGSPQSVTFGPGCLEGLGDALARLSVRRALVVTGPTVAASPLLQRLLATAGSCDMTVFDGSVPHAPRTAARRGLEALESADADAVVTLGGSSPVDVARGILLLHATRKDFDDLRDHPRPGRTAMLPLICVTTTLSQAEFSNVAGITDDVTGEKELFFDWGLMPRQVFLDATMTTETPERLWLSTGIKALDTTIDIFLQFLDEQPFWDGLSLAAAARLFDLLPRSARDPEDVDVRQRLQVAAWMGEFPRFHLPVDRSVPAASHWFGAAARHQFGGMYGVPHGELAGVILRGALEFHLEQTLARQRMLAGALGLKGEGNLHEAIPKFVESLQLPSTLGDLGIDASRLGEVVEAVVSEEPGLEERRGEMVAVLERML